MVLSFTAKVRLDCTMAGEKFIHSGPGGPAVVEKLKSVQTEISKLIMQNAKIIKVSHAFVNNSCNVMASTGRPTRVPQPARQAPRHVAQQNQKHSRGRLPRP